jgi:two-component system cell cycle response regulator DivK
MTTSLLQNKRIFLVEDNLGNRAIMQMILEQHGAKISFERWGTDTVSRLKVFEPVDLILLDLMFPQGITGYDVFDNIRQHTEFRHVPIVAVSASEPALSIPKTQAHGFAGFLPKPIDIDKFPKQVAAILRNEPVWDFGGLD